MRKTAGTVVAALPAASAARGALRPRRRMARGSGLLRRLDVRIERVMTDSGCGRVFKMFGAACVELGVRHVRSRPTRPRPTARPSGSASRHREWTYGLALDN